MASILRAVRNLSRFTSSTTRTTQKNTHSHSLSSSKNCNLIKKTDNQIRRLPLPALTSYKFRHGGGRTPPVRKAHSPIRYRGGADADVSHNTAVELALNSVVKVFTVSCSPNYLLPWQNKAQRETMGSG